MNNWAVPMLADGFKMVKLATMFACSALLVGGPLFSQPALPKASVLVKHAEWVRCSEPFAMKLALEVKLRNLSEKPLLVGRLNVAQERYYSRDEKQQLQVSRTSSTPDDFVTPVSPEGDAKDFAGIQEQFLPRNQSKTSTGDHYVYVNYSDVQLDQGGHTLMISFHITNVMRDGSMSDYWTDPVTVNLVPWPPHC